MPPAMFEPARRWQRHIHDHGYAGLNWPAEYGGQGLGQHHANVWFEECARRELAAYMNFQGFMLAGPAIIKYGTEAQKAQYLAPTLSADIVWCQLFSEPDAGSDLAGLATRAEPAGGGWQVSGQKIWSSTAQLAHHAILMARTDPTEPAHRGISFFLFDMAGAGVDVRPIKQMTGDHEFCEVFLDQAWVGAEDLLGPLGAGWKVAMSVLADERASVGAAGIGLEMRSARMIDRLGKDPGPGARDRVVGVAASAQALRRMLDRSPGDPRLGPLVKLANTEFETERTRVELDLLGAAAMLGTNESSDESDGRVQEAFLYAPGMRVAGGTSEIQRNLIGERLLGLPREPR